MLYFPGLRFTGHRELSKAMEIPKAEITCEDLPILYRFGWGGIECPEFLAALVAAYRHVGMDDMARRYENYKPRLCGRKGGGLKNQIRITTALGPTSFSAR